MTPALETAPGLLVAIAIAAYLVGSVPFGLVTARGFGLGDIRQIGSGNIGATNVLRAGSRPAAALTLLLDAGKGAVAVLIARLLGAEDAAQIAAGAVFLGHCFPLFLGFRGGKGVATFLGTLLALAWPVGALACLMWLVTAFVSRRSSLSALVAAATTPIWAAWTGHAETVALTILLAALIFLRHRANIQRLIAGTEPKIGAGDSQGGSDKGDGA